MLPHSCFTMSQTQALMEILAQLIAQDDAVLALQLLKFMRDVSQSPITIDTGLAATDHSFLVLCSSIQ